MISTDVVVVGAGPAGSTTAAYLADAGHEVLILEKESIPRFHIGESLLPVCLPILQRLGISPESTSYLYKRGAEFIDERHHKRRAFDFADALPGCPSHAWQVERASFDRQLCERAQAAGARLMPKTKVVGVQFEPTRVVVEPHEGEPISARYLVDASGQNRLLARRHRSAQPVRRFGETAAFVHFDGLGATALEEIGGGHDIRIMITDQGWGWLIPISGRRLSVGLVCRDKRVAARHMQAYLEHSALIQRWTAGCTNTEIRVERNFSFVNTQPHGARYCCVGDAACFLDPVFSSGVSLAMVGAERIAQTLGPALADGREATPALMVHDFETMDRGYRTFFSMIDRFYNTHFLDHFIFGPSVTGSMYQGVVSVLAGDVWRDDNDFQTMLLRSRRQPAQSQRVQ